MAKTPRRKGQTPVPSADQFAAVRRVADAGDLPKARQRLAALRKSFPGFKPLLGLAWEVEDRCGEPMLAAARAYEWQGAPFMNIRARRGWLFADTVGGANASANLYSLVETALCRARHSDLAPEKRNP